ncbi:glycoside hydrolase family 2 protein [Ideonella sp. YS5]|uniref:glycoside hydrolase family 2 protein n=1 Tax=Ideonella sp. YS5 TaxID=3453714 RepID=UPI003EEF8937
MVALPARMRLAGTWALTPGEPGQEQPPPQSPWLPIDGPVPVAAALAAAGRWSLDGPARDFDAECWWYRCCFDSPPGAGPDAILGLDGLATLAAVWLNGERLLDSRSMFRRHRVPLGARLREQGNELLIRFDPLNVELARRRPRPRWRTPMLAQQQLRWFRTTLLGRTPGWSPPAAVVGPWRDIWLAPPAELADIDCRPRLVGQAGELEVRCRLPASVDAVRVRLDHDGEPRALDLRPVAREDGSTEWSGTLRIEHVAPWWPATHGTPATHPVTLQLRHADGSEQVLQAGRVGFRTVSIDTSRGGFGLVINGEPVFARGVCWVPLDTLRLHAEREQYREVLTRWRDAGVNLIRVGGTMAYEHEAFFELCDELGLMVWQELMFANMDHPGDDPAFAAEVDAELAGELPRWRRHASVVVVCGNSEVEQQAAMWGAGREHWQPALFHERIASAVKATLPDVAWWPSSAHGGAFPFQADSGTTSYYGVGAYRRDLADARASGLRFATECLAFAQVPSDQVLGRLRGLNHDLPVRSHSALWKTRSPRDLGAGWDFDEVRDHYVRQLFGEDPERLRQADPARHLVLGRAAAGEAIASAFSQWRAAGSACRGALVWFARDLWAGAGWGLLDDLGQPKAAFHALSRVCQPLHLGITDEGLNGLALHAVNEHGRAFEGRLTLRLYREGEWPVAETTRELELPARSCQGWNVCEWLDGFIDLSWAYRFGPAPADLLLARWEGEEASAERVYFIDVPGATLRRADLGLVASAVECEPGVIEVRLGTRAAARAVHFEAEGWLPADEYFDLAPGAERHVRFTPWPDHPRRPWRATVTAINALAAVAVPLQPD